MKTHLSPFAAASLALVISAGPAVAAKGPMATTVTVGGINMIHQVYLPDEGGKHPVVVVLPEWWGNNDYSKGRAKQLADMGYVAVAADLYGDGRTTEDPKEAGKLAGDAKKDRAGLRARALSALDAAKARPEADGAKAGVVGYCFGGNVALDLARQGADIKAAVSLHGSMDFVDSPKAGGVKAKVLVLHGGADPMVANDAVNGFVADMKIAKADVELITYPAAEHAFSNPGADDHKIPGVKYDKSADEKSFAAMKAFFDKTLK